MPTKASVVVAVTIGKRRYLRTVAVMVENPTQIVRAIDQSRDKLMADLAKATTPAIPAIPALKGVSGGATLQPKAVQPNEP